MAFPQTPLPLQVDVSLDGATWTDITSDVRAEQQVQITRGRSDWGQQVDYGRCSLTLGNADGRYSPRNPSGPYYGQIGRNTPLRVSVNTGSVALDLPGGAGDYASTPDVAALDITGDIDIRIDATLTNWIQADYPSQGQTDYTYTELIAKQDDLGQSWALYMKAGRPYFEWVNSGGGFSNVWGTDVPLTTSGRIALRVTLDVDNGSGGCTVTIYTAPTIAGPWTALDVANGASTTSIKATTASLKIGDATTNTAGYEPGLGRVHAAQVYSGIGGTLVASPDFTAQTSGTTSFTDSAGRVWSLSGNAAINNRKTRFVGEVSSWTPHWDTGGFDPTVAVEAAGVMRRLGVGKVPTKSPMYREFSSSGRMAAGIFAYWPMEDGADATRLASAFAGQTAMTIKQPVTLASYGDWVGSDPIPTITSGGLTASVPSYTTGAAVLTTTGFFVKVPAGGVLSTQRLVSLSLTGSLATVSVWVNTAGNLAVRGYDVDGTQVHDSGFGTDSIVGLEKYLVFQVSQNALNTLYVLTVTDVAGSLLTAIPNNTLTTFSISNTIASYQPGHVTTVRFGQDAGMNGTAIGHLAIGNTGTSFTASIGAVVGWTAEQASSRTARIGKEEGIASYPTGGGDEQCGQQPRDTALGIMRAAGDVDAGILAEQRSILGLRYVTRASMYNQLPTLTLNYQGDDGLVAPLEPTDDDQNVTNDVTVARTNGASARRTLDTGTLSTQDPPDGIGLYDTSYTLGLLDDTQPSHHAGWLLHLGTWDETRYPVVRVNLATAPASIENASAVDVGSRIQITNPPAWLPPGTIDLQVQGYSETLDQFTWNLSFNCTPYGPWNIAVADATQYSRVDTDGSQLAAAMTSTATTAIVQATSGPIWTPDVTQLPFDIQVAGEIMQVQPSGTVLTTNPSFETDLSGWTPTNATATRSQAVARIGSWSCLLTTGAGLSPRIEDTKRAVTAGNTYTALGWLYAPAALPTTAGVNVNWYDASQIYMTTSFNSATLTPGVWTPFNAQFTAPVGAAFAGVLFAVNATPGAGYQLYGDGIKLINGSGGIQSWLSDTFTRTVANGWGSADTGQAWTTSGGATSDYSTTGTTGNHSLTSVNVSRYTVTAAPSADVDLVATVSTSALAAGGPHYVGLVARWLDANNSYYARLACNTDQTLTLVLQKRVGGTQTDLATVNIPGTHAAGAQFKVRFQVSGSTLRARAWPVASLEPSLWQATITDTSLTAAGSVGVRSILSSTNTNTLPVTASYDNAQVLNPQTFTVVRSVNGVVKAQSAGAAVSLAYPAYAPL
ncbi:carbohydrate binding domain-containing protein [Streptomyces sp. NPDC004059]